jgi:hypothetical protein
MRNGDGYRYKDEREGEDDASASSTFRDLASKDLVT